MFVYHPLIYIGIGIVIGILLDEGIRLLVGKSGYSKADFISVAVTLVWLLSTTGEYLNPNFQTNLFVQILFGIVLSSVIPIERAKPFMDFTVKLLRGQKK